MRATVALKSWNRSRGQESAWNIRLPRVSMALRGQCVLDVMPHRTMRFGSTAKVLAECA